LLDSQFQRITVVIDRPDARKQDRIKAYIIAECGQQRRNLQCDTLHLIVRAGLVQIEKYIADIIQPPPTEFERFDRIGKSRFPGIAGDGGYFGARLPERMTESRQIMFVANPVECRCGVRTGPALQQRIAGERIAGEQAAGNRIVRRRNIRRRASRGGRRNTGTSVLFSGRSIHA